jgi:hypothetical protein
MNLYPRTGSPIIDSGQEIGVDFDFDTNIRPNQGGSDIGAYEYNENNEAEKVKVFERTDFFDEDESNQQDVYLWYIGFGAIFAFLCIFIIRALVRKD